MEPPASLLDQARKLPLTERAKLVVEILASMDGESGVESDGDSGVEVERAWATEIEVRTRRAVQGLTSARDWDQVRDEMLAALQADRGE